MSKPSASSNHWPSRDQTPRMTESPTKSHVDEPMQEHAAGASIAQRGSAAQLSAAQLSAAQLILFRLFRP